MCGDKQCTHAYPGAYNLLVSYSQHSLASGPDYQRTMCGGCRLFQEVEARQEAGVKCSVGQHGEAQALFYPVVPFIVCDNKEGWSLAHLKSSGSTARPCRFCSASGEGK